MNMRNDPNRPDRGRVSGKDMADALADVLKEENEKAQSRTNVPPGGKHASSAGKWAALVLLSSLSAYLWIGSPSWLQPTPPPPLSPALEDAGLRMEVFQEALLVEEFRDREGRLPNSLSEAGDLFSEVTYQALDGQSYRLAFSGRKGSVEYASGDSLELFLGDAVRVIKEGG